MLSSYHWSWSTVYPTSFMISGRVMVTLEMLMRSSIYVYAFARLELRIDHFTVYDARFPNALILTCAIDMSASSGPLI